MVFPSICNSISTAFTPLYVAKIAVDKAEGNRYASRMLTQTFLIGTELYMMTTVLNSNKIFFSSQFGSLLYNGFIIIVIFYFHGNQSIENLMLTVVGSSIILVIALFVFIRNNRIEISITYYIW